MKEKLKEKLQCKHRLKTRECPKELDIWAREFYTEEILGGIFIQYLSKMLTEGF